MKYLKLFENFTRKTESRIKEISSILQDAAHTTQVRFYIPACPARLKNYKIMYRIDTDKLSIVDDDGNEILETSSANLIGNYIMIERCTEKGLSIDCASWLEETMMIEDFTWDELIEELVQKCEPNWYTDKDLKILGVDVNKKRGALTGKKFKI